MNHQWTMRFLGAKVDQPQAWQKCPSSLHKNVSPGAAPHCSDCTAQQCVVKDRLQKVETHGDIWHPPTTHLIYIYNTYSQIIYLSYLSFPSKHPLKTFGLVTVTIGPTCNWSEAARIVAALPNCRSFRNGISSPGRRFREARLLLFGEKPWGLLLYTWDDF